MELFPKPPSILTIEKEKWPIDFVTEEELLQKAVAIENLNPILQNLNDILCLIWLGVI